MHDRGLSIRPTCGAMYIANAKRLRRPDDRRADRARAVEWSARPGGLRLNDGYEAPASRLHRPGMVVGCSCRRDHALRQACDRSLLFALRGEAPVLREKISLPCGRKL